MSQHNKIQLKNTNENDMVTTVELDKLNKTSVKWGFKPDDVEYIGKVNIKDLEEEKDE